MEGLETDSVNYDTSRNRRLLNESHDSESDGEEGVSGFYVREKKECASSSPSETLIVNSVENEDVCDSYSNGIAEKNDSLADESLIINSIDEVSDEKANTSNVESEDDEHQSSHEETVASESKEKQAESVENQGSQEETIAAESKEKEDENEVNQESKEKEDGNEVNQESREKEDGNEINRESKEKEDESEINREKMEDVLTEVEPNKETEKPVEGVCDQSIQSTVRDEDSMLEVTNDDSKADSEETESATSETGSEFKKSDTISENDGHVPTSEANKKETEDSHDRMPILEDQTKNFQKTLPDSEKIDKKSKVDIMEEAEDVEMKITRNEIAKVSFLKEQLLQPKSSGNKPSENNDQVDMEDMEDFDPSLLCPDISMDVDESPVITNSENGSQNEGCSSPLPYEATFSTYVDEMTGAEVTFNLTPEECELRSKLFGPEHLVQFSKIHCTACNVHLGSALDAQKNRFVHPLLKVLICRNCYHFYTSGEFEKDEDGSELYCRWCGQGGQVLCCSTCEFVFCKRCIKNNFGLKKFKEIRDSDDWTCFRCAPEQLSILRASCAEFMDYVRTEISRAATLIKDVPSFMTTDYTTCCSQQPPKKRDDSTPKEPKRRKRKGSCEDPDYSPLRDLEPPEKKAAVAAAAAPAPPLPAIAPKPRVYVPQAAPARPPQQSFRVGNTMFRPRGAYAMARPAGPSGQNTIRVPGPGYIKILPQKAAAPPAPRLAPVSLRQQLSKPIIVQSPRGPQPAQPAKHEWFEKTVRAAARVNSNLSYTLTQLNRQQAGATTVEALAVVHNKLQEVLSTSINSLIQIRKNLRSEFISGIKSIKFPPKQQIVVPVRPQVIRAVKNDDDDVIFVSNAVNPVVNPVSAPAPMPKIVLPPSVTIKPAKKPNDLYTNPSPSTSFSNDNRRPGGYIKVKSFSALQNVPSECITIPDDPPPLAPIQDKINTSGDSVIEVKDVDEKTSEIEDDADKRGDVKENSNKKTEVEESADKKRDNTSKCEVKQSSEKESEVKESDEKKSEVKESAVKKSEVKESCEKKSEVKESYEKKSEVKESAEKKMEVKESDEKKSEVKESDEKKSEVKKNAEKKRGVKESAEKRSEVKEDKNDEEVNSEETGTNLEVKSMRKVAVILKKSLDIEKMIERKCKNNEKE